MFSLSIVEGYEHKSEPLNLSPEATAALMTGNGVFTTSDSWLHTGVYPIKDSGARRDFGTGAVRDAAEGKGRCDLMPLDVVAEIMRQVVEEVDSILWHIDRYVRTGDVQALYEAIDLFMGECPNSAGTHSKAIWMLDISKHYEAGCQKYGDRNWEKGIPLHCYIDSAVRHYLKFIDGQTDEPHDRACIWNLMCAIWTHKHRPEMIDLPFTYGEGAI